MNESTHGIRRDQAQQPQNKHYNGNGIKPMLLPFQFHEVVQKYPHRLTCPICMLSQADDSGRAWLVQRMLGWSDHNLQNALGLRGPALELIDRTR
jgi:hypothetical protein